MRFRIDSDEREVIQTCYEGRNSFINMNIIYYSVVHFRNFIHHSFKPFKGSRFPSHPVEVSICCPLWSLISSGRQIWRCKTIPALIWSGCFCVWLILHLTLLWKLITAGNSGINLWKGSQSMDSTIDSSLALVLLRRSLRILMKGVAPIPNPMRSSTSKFLKSCAGAP